MWYYCECYEGRDVKKFIAHKVAGHQQELTARQAVLRFLQELLKDQAIVKRLAASSDDGDQLRCNLELLCAALPHLSFATGEQGKTFRPGRTYGDENDREFRGAFRDKVLTAGNIQASQAVSKISPLRERL